MADPFNAYDHYPGFQNAKTHMFSAAGGNPVSASGFALASTGTLFLDQNVSAATAVIPIHVKEGDIITKFRVLGAIGATTSNATVVDASLRKVTKGAGAVVDASVGAITQVSVSADTALDSEVDVTDETVADDYQYYVLVTATTADNAANDLFITGVEVDIKRT